MNNINGEIRNIQKEPQYIVSKIVDHNKALYSFK